LVTTLVEGPTQTVRIASLDLNVHVLKDRRNEWVKFSRLVDDSFLADDAQKILEALEQLS
jgi:hypothetical protein